MNEKWKEEDAKLFLDQFDINDDICDMETVFTSEFDERMNRLFNELSVKDQIKEPLTTKQTTPPKVQFNWKQVSSIIAASIILILILIGPEEVFATGQRIISMITTQMGTFVGYSWNDNETESSKAMIGLENFRIEHEIPGNFELTDETMSAFSLLQIYKNDANWVRISVNDAKSIRYAVDSEYAEYREFEHGETTIYSYTKGGETLCFMETDGWIISVDTNLDIDHAIKILKSIRLEMNTEE